MSTAKFFRNFLTLPKMGAKNNSCHITRENGHQNEDLKLMKTQGSSFSTPEAKFSNELQITVNLDQSSDQCEKVSEDVLTTDLNTTTSLEHGFRNLRTNLKVIGTADAKDKDENVKEENRRGQVETVTNNGPTRSSGKENEIKNESTAECLPNTDIHTSLVCPVEFTSMADGRRSLKDIKTEEEVNAPTNICDRDYVKTLNVTPKTNALEAEASDDECISIASSDAEIYEEADSQEETLEAVITTDVNNLTASAGVRLQFPSQSKLNKNSKTHEPLLPLNSCTAPVELPFHLGDGQIQEAHSLKLESSRSTTTNSRSRLTCSESQHQKSLRSRVLSKGKVGIVSESGISSRSTAKRTSSQDASKDYSSVIKKRMRISVAADVVYNDEVSSPEGSKCSASNHSDEGKQVPSSSSSLHGISSPVTSSSSLNTIDPLLLSRVPPGATLLIYPGIFTTKHMDKSGACVFCGEPSKMKNVVFAYSIQQQNEKLHFLCNRCHHKLVYLEERYFSCNICKLSFKNMDDLVSHSKVHKKEKLRKCLICNICKKEFTHASTLKLHLMSHSGEKSFSYEEEEDVLSTERLQHKESMDTSILSSSTFTSLHMEIYDDADNQKSKIHKNEAREVVTKVAANDLAVTAKSFQFPSQTKLTNNYETEHELILSSSDSLSMEQLQDNSSHVEISIHPFSLEQNHLQTECNCSMAPSRSAATFSDSVSCSMNDLANNAIERSSDDLCNEMASECEVSIVRESKILNASQSNLVDDSGSSLKKFSNEFQFAMSLDHGSDQCEKKVSEDVLTTDLNQEHDLPDQYLNLRIVGTAIAKDIDENLSVKENNRKEQVDAATNNRQICSSGRETEMKNESTAEYVQSRLPNTEIHTSVVCPVEFTESSKSSTNNSVTQFRSCLKSGNLHGEVLSKGKVAIVGESRISKDTEKPFACGYCRKVYPKKWIVYAHIIQQHEKKEHFPHEVGDNGFGNQCHLSEEIVISHTREETVHHCDKCGMGFRLKSDLCRHGFIHAEDRLFSCNICNFSYTSRADLFSHSKDHICNVCKKFYRRPSHLKQHMMFHSCEKSLKPSLFDEQVDTVAGSRPTCSSGLEKETREESTSEYGRHSFSNSNIHANVVNSEEEVNAPIDIFDELFQDFVNTLNSTKTNDLEVIISDDECSSTASSSDNMKIYEEPDCQDIENHKGENEETLIKRVVNNLPETSDVRFQPPSQLKSNGNKNNNKTQENTNQEHLFSPSNCSVSVDQLSDKSGYLETHNLPFPPEDCQIQEVHSLALESNKSATTSSSYLQLRCFTRSESSQAIETDDGQHKTNYENINSSTVDGSRGDVEPPTECQSEGIDIDDMDVDIVDIVDIDESIKIERIIAEPVIISDDECSSIASL